MEGAHRRRVAGHRAVADTIGLRAGSGCGPTHCRYAEAGHRGAPVPQRSGAGRSAEGACTAGRHRRRRPGQPDTGGDCARVADACRRRVRADGLGGGATDARHRRRRTRHVGHRRRGRRTAQAREGSGRRGEGAQGAPAPSSTTTPSLRRLPRTSSTRSVIGGRWQEKRSSGSRRGWRLCNDFGAGRPATSGGRCPDAG